MSFVRITSVGKVGALVSLGDIKKKKKTVVSGHDAWFGQGWW